MEGGLGKIPCLGSKGSGPSLLSELESEASGDSYPTLTAQSSRSVAVF